jgi:fumarylacetoacetase
MTAVHPGPRSWVDVPDDACFTLATLPYGAFETAAGEHHVGVALGEHVLDLTALERAGLLDGGAGALFEHGTLNPLLAAGRPTWTSVRTRVRDLLDAGNGELRDDAHARGQALLRQADVVPQLPFAVGDFADFYGCKEHAENVGAIFRPDDEPLLPHWPHMPIGTHGHRSGVRVSGANVVRPAGQSLPAGAHGVPQPTYGLTAKLDFELELGYVVGSGNEPGRPIATAQAADHLFGLVLVNDWSARDIQRWEYRPMGPFAGKSFLTAVSPWVVPFEALEPFRVRGPEPMTPLLPYLQVTDPWNLDLKLEVLISTAAMDEQGLPPHAIVRVGSSKLYWNAAQILAHVTANGATVTPGDLYCSGTVSGHAPGTQGCLLEVTRDGAAPVALPSGERRGYLEDGDTVILRGWAGGDGRPRVGLGEVCTTVRPGVPA